MIELLLLLLLLRFIIHHYTSLKRDTCWLQAPCLRFRLLTDSPLGPDVCVISAPYPCPPTSAACLRATCTPKWEDESALNHQGNENKRSSRKEAFFKCLLFGKSRNLKKVSEAKWIKTQNKRHVIAKYCCYTCILGRGSWLASESSRSYYHTTYYFLGKCTVLIYAHEASLVLCVCVCLFWQFPPVRSGCHLALQGEKRKQWRVERKQRLETLSDSKCKQMGRNVPWQCCIYKLILFN